jgi:hypothetical protein
VDVGALALLGGGVGGLEDEGGLGCEEDAGGIEELGVISLAGEEWGLGTGGIRDAQRSR